MTTTVGDNEIGKISKNVYGKIRVNFSTFVFISFCLEVRTDSRFIDSTSFAIYTQQE
jgi:hypothetical protein